MTLTKTKTITVSKLSHRQNQKSGFISYSCELRVGRTCYASVEQEGNGGDERVDWNSTENYLFIHHWILNTQKEFYRDSQYESLNYYWKEAREIQEKLGFFDDMVGTWTTVYVENKLAHRYN